MTEQQILGHTCAILTALTWAFAMVCFKLSGERVAPLALNLFKNVVGLTLLVLTLWGMWAMGRGDGIAIILDAPSRDIWLLLISGVIGIAMADTLFFHALNLIGVGIVAIVDCLYSPFIILFAFVMLSESLSWLQYIGAALILSAVLVSSRLKPPRNRTHKQLIAGILLGAAAMGLMAFGIVLVKPILTGFPLIWATTLRVFAGTLSLVVIALVSRRRKDIFSAFRPATVWKWSLPGSFLGAYVSMVLWVAGFKYIDASVASILNQTSTIFAIVLATVLLKEPFTRRKFAVLVLAMMGVALVQLGDYLAH
ncbi:MAG: DMT family transporter [Planctomycetota bacterium]